MSKASPRHLAREVALQAIYQWQMNHTHHKDLREQFFESGFEEPIDEKYFSDLIQGVTENVDKIDETA